MATNIDKALYGAPVGIAEMAQDEPELEIEIVNPEEVNIGIDGLEISLRPDDDAEDGGFDANLAEDLDEGFIATLGSDLSADITQDVGSRKEWEKAYVEGLKLLGLQMEERTEPWNGACGVFRPMITEAVVKFQSEMITETFPAQGPVKT